MKAHYEAAGVTVFHGDCLDVLRELPDESVHAVVTDPPYGLSNTDPGHVSEAIAHWTTGDRTFLPSAGGGFMGKAWDEFVPPPAVWDECMRVLKTGGHLLAFAGSRTVDLMALSVRLAGFDIRDSIAWLYGSGFPKSLDVAKAIDKRQVGSDEVDAFKRALGDAVRASGKSRTQINAECGFTMRFDITFDRDPAGWGCSLPTADQYDVILRVLGATDVADIEQLRQWPRTSMEKLYEVVGYESRTNSPSGIVGVGREAKQVDRELTKPGTDEARKWEGWGTALKPAFEPIVVARKPLAGTVAANVLAHGTGALNIDASRIATTDEVKGSTRPHDIRGGRYAQGTATAADLEKYEQPAGGRWPANVVLDESQAAELDRQAPDTGGSGRASGPSLRGATTAGAAFGARNGLPDGRDPAFYGDRGGASRMFPRFAMTDEDWAWEARVRSLPTFRYEAKAPTSERPVVDGVAHPTVKPLDLMRWLVRLVTPKGGTVLEPFAGSGTTVEACIREGFDVIAIEREADYLPLIEKRIRKDHVQGLDFDWGEAS